LRALFPVRRRVLHLFSGKVDLSTVPGDTRRGSDLLLIFPLRQRALQKF
jgi:hypothetical protein